MGNVLSFPAKTYSAKSTSFLVNGIQVTMSGTLDGFIDLAFTPRVGGNRTYQMDLNEARMLIAGLNTTIADIQQNCLYDRDPLLEKEKPNE